MIATFSAQLLGVTVPNGRSKKTISR